MGLYGSNDLVMQAGRTYTRTLRRQVDGDFQSWLDQTYHLELFQLDTRELLIDLTVFLTLAVDPTKLLLSVPGRLVTTLPAESLWQLRGFHGADPDDGYRLPGFPGRVLVAKGPGG